MYSLNIQSDFVDYYDILNNEKSTFVYNRYIGNSKSRGTVLKELRNLGVKTIELKQVSQFYKGEGPLVVYVDPKEHKGKGKLIMSVEDAQLAYPNSLASPYIETTNGYILKYVHVGKRRFALYYKKDEPISLNMGRLIDINEATPEYNRQVGLPIYSIDYIVKDNNEMVATDFNMVQSLGNIGLQSKLTAENVIDEIVQALAIYNKY